MRWFVRGDVDGFFGLALDNLVQLLLINTLCLHVLHFPPQLLQRGLQVEAVVIVRRDHVRDATVDVDPVLDELVDLLRIVRHQLHGLDVQALQQ